MFDNVYNFVKIYYFSRLIPTYSSVGQNLYIGFSTKKTEDCPVEKAVMAWYNEVLKFSVANLDPFIFVEATGHYTQLAWGDTYKVATYFLRFVFNKRQNVPISKPLFYVYSVCTISARICIKSKTF